MNKKEVKRICINCGSENYYAKQLCKNCYAIFIRTGLKTPEEFVEYSNKKGENTDKKYKIKMLSSVLKFQYSDIGNICGVSRQCAHKWFNGNHSIPEKYISIVYDYFINLANDAYNVIRDQIGGE